MNQGRDRRGAFHGVWQPHVQWKLCRFTHCAHKQTDADDTQQQPFGSGQRFSNQTIGLTKNFGVVQGTGVACDQANTQDETKVAHAVHQEGFHVGKHRCRALEPEADQQVGHQAHGFPAEEQLKQVVAHDEHQHGERKQRDV